MATPRASANQRQRTWRPQAPQPEQTARRRRVIRVLLPVLGIGLLGLLAWMLILWLWRTPKLELIAIAVADYRNPEAPPIPYCYEDLEALREVIPDEDSKKSTLWNDAATKSIAQLQTALRQSSSRRDNLLVYIKAHGVSLKGAPFILGGDFELVGDAGRLPVKELLDDVAASPARVKLLVLDTGHLESDPPMGMVTNQFSRLVEQAVADMSASEDLWVLTSNSLYERAQVSLEDRRSAFGYFVAEGLRGAADGVVAGQPADDSVQLNELYQYVHQHVGHFARVMTSDKQSQTPQLMRAGEGTVQKIPEDVLLLHLPPAAADAPEGEVALKRPARSIGAAAGRVRGALAMALAFQDAGDGNPSGSTPPAAESKDGKTAEVIGDSAKKADEATKGSSTAAAAESKSEEPSAENKSVDAKAAPAAKELEAAKDAGESAKKTEKQVSPPAAKPARRRTSLEESLFKFDTWLASELSRETAWRAIDYAPDLTRLYYKDLLACRQRALAGHLFLSQPDYQASLERKLSELSDIQGRIRTRGEMFAQGLARPTYEADREIRGAIRVRNEACFLLPLLTAHHARSSGSAPAALLGEYRKLSGAAMALDRLLRADAPSTQQAFEQWKGALRASQKTVRDQLAKLHDDFQTRCEEQKRALNSDNVETVAGTLAELAENPLATPAQREELYELSGKVKVRFADVERSQRPPLSNPNLFSELGWQRVLERAQLELDLLAFVLTDERDGRVAELRTSIGSAAGLTDAGPQLSLATRIDGLLNGAYRNLPDRLSAQLRSNNYAAWRGAESAIRLADARDQEPIDKVLNERTGRAWTNPFTGVPLAALPKLEAQYSVKLGGASAASAGGVPLKLDVLDKLPLRFASNAPLPERLRVRLDYDDRRVRLRALGNELRAGSVLEVSSGSQAGSAISEFTTQLEIASLDERGDQTKLQVLWLDETNGELDSASATLIHPSPSYLQLAVFGQRGMANRHSWRDGARGESYFEVPSPEGLAHVRLLTFAGHENRFDFRLTNTASYGKKYTAVVYAIPRSEPIDESTNRVLSLVAAAERSARELARNELTFAAGQTVSVPFYPAPAAKPAAAEKADAAKAGETKDAEAAAKEPPPEVSGGLVCVLTEAPKSPPDATFKPRVQRIVVEFKTLLPDRYIRPRVSYDAGDGQIEVELNAEPERLPPGGATIELEVVAAQPDTQRGKVLKTTLTAKKTAGELRSYVKPGTPGVAKVYLHVDGYPRAFIYDVALDASKSDVERKLRELHNVALPKSFKIYYPKTVPDPLPFSFAVDMPPSSDRAYKARLFIDSQPGDDSFVPLEDKLVYESFDDRVHQTALVKPKDGGGVVFQTRVSDFAVMLDLGAYENQPVYVRAQLVEVESQGAERVLGSPDDLADKQIVLYLDGEPPAITIRTPNRSVYENDKLHVDLNAHDVGSGVKQVAYALKLQKNPDTKAAAEYVLAEPKPVPRQGKDAFQLTQTFEKLGDQSIWFQATDNSGNESEIKEAKFDVVKRPTAAGKGPPAPGELLGKIEGRATLPEGVGGKITKVILSQGDKVVKELPNPPDGRFVFDKLRPGDYEVKAEGTIAGNFGKPKPVTVTVEAGKRADPGVVTLGR